MENCLFCKISNKEIPSDIVYESEIFSVFMDKYPDSPGHMLVVPKAHIKDALDMDDDTFKQMNKIIKKMMTLINERLKPDGIVLIQNNGVCQEIKHYHMHIIPKYEKETSMTNEKVYSKLMGGK